MNKSTTFEWGARLPTLSTPRLALRALSESDVADVFSVFSDPVVMRYWDGSVMATQQDAMKYIEQIRQGFRRRELFQWGIADAANDTVIGTCTLIRWSPNHERCEIGFALRQTCWGKGLGFEAVTALIEFAFTTLELHRLEADVDPRNDRSLRLLERCGFRREGLLRERYYVNGERQDTLMLGLLRREWPGR